MKRRSVKKRQIVVFMFAPLIKNRLPIILIILSIYLIVCLIITFDVEDVFFTIIFISFAYI